MAKGMFLDRGQGKIYSARGSTMTFKASHDNTNGAFSLMERSLRVANRRPQSHTHKGAEGFYVLEGRIEFILGQNRRAWILDAGTKPRIAHIGNVGDSPTRLLIIHSPAADGYFADAEALWKDSTPTADEERKLIKGHGIKPGI